MSLDLGQSELPIVRGYPFPASTPQPKDDYNTRWDNQVWWGKNNQPQNNPNAYWDKSNQPQNNPNAYWDKSNQPQNNPDGWWTNHP